MAELPLGLLGFAAGALQSSGPSRMPIGFGQAMGNALQGGLQNYGLLSQVEGQKTQNQMRQMQFVQQMAEQRKRAEREATQAEYVNEAIGGLPPEQQKLARANPDAFLGAQVKGMFETPSMTPLQQDLIAAGFTPGSPEYSNAIMRNRFPEKGPLSTTHITMPSSGPQFGTVAPGYMMVQTGPNSWEQMPVPGGPVDREMQEAAAKAEGLEATKNIARGTVVQDTGRALELLEQRGDLVSGPVAAGTRYLPGTDAYVMQGHIDSIGSNIGLDVLQTMRENSPTGGALGQVPIQQQQRLEAVYGNLALGQPAEVIADNLKRIDNIYNDLIHGTPAQIQKAVDEGRISAEAAAPLMQRYELSFDERGRPVGQAQSDPASVDAIVDRWAPQ